MIEKFKISYFEQSFSKLFVRALKKSDDGFFKCYVFWGVKEISMPSIFETDGNIIETISIDKKLKYFEFSASDNARVLATSVRVERCLDFPEVEKVRLIGKPEDQ